jgi:hypothetical protein
MGATSGRSERASKVDSEFSFCRLRELNEQHRGQPEPKRGRDELTTGLECGKQQRRMALLSVEQVARLS